MNLPIFNKKIRQKSTFWSILGLWRVTPHCGESPRYTVRIFTATNRSYSFYYSKNPTMNEKLSSHSDVINSRKWMCQPRTPHGVNHRGPTTLPQWCHWLERGCMGGKMIGRYRIRFSHHKFSAHAQSERFGEFAARKISLAGDFFFFFYFFSSSL